MSTYNAKLRDAIYIALSNEPLSVEELARRTSYSTGYIHAQFLHIRRDLSLDWTVRFVGHGHRTKYALMTRDSNADNLMEGSIKVGNDSWLATTENKCVSLRKHCEIAAQMVPSPEAKLMYEKVIVLMAVAQDMVAKARAA